MEKIKILLNRANLRIIQKVIFHLKEGGIFIYPTETAYALGGDALNLKVIKKIFSLKSRSKKNPLPVIVGFQGQAEKIAVLNPLAKKLAKKYWPGPLTLIIKKKKVIPSLLTCRKNKIALRVSGLSLARMIAKMLKKPLISTSANVSGKKECYNVDAILKQLPELKKSDCLILDAGNLPPVKPSTIVDVTGKKMKVLRNGSVKVISY